jgi:hypothetical protein
MEKACGMDAGFECALLGLRIVQGLLGSSNTIDGSTIGMMAEQGWVDSWVRCNQVARGGH